METQVTLADREVTPDPPMGHEVFGSGGRPRGKSLARIAVFSVLAIASLFGGSVTIVYRLTDIPAAQLPVAAHPAAAPALAATVPPSVPRAPISIAPPSMPTLPRTGTAARRAAPAKPRQASGDAQLASKINVALKLDPRLTQGLHMGERWVSSSSYTGHRGEGVVLEAKAGVLDVKGGKLDASPTWTPAEPDMVAVSPDRGDHVELRVSRPGRSSVRVSYGSAAKTLNVKAVPDAGTLRVEISQ